MKHLTSEQISSVVAGWSRDENEQQHVSACPVCAAEIERLRELLTQFRTSIRDWSEGSQTIVNLPRPVSPRYPDRVHPRRVVWVLAAAALAIAVAVPVYQDVREREMKAQADADYLLIESVQSQLSRSAPMAMQPLMQLVAPTESDPDSGAADRRERE
jgi:hypothetical protein